jgi:putative intracellular protease/amidase
MSAPVDPSRAPRVLVVVSAADRLPLRQGGDDPTGTYLGELIEPTDAMRDAGFQLFFATPGGKVPTIDGTSCSLMYFGMSRRKRDAALASYTRLLECGLATPAPLDEVAHDTERLARFDALFVPGGHAPLVDLLHRDAFADDSLNEDFGALLQYFHAQQRTTALICHAPAALAAAPEIDGRWIYDGYRMTCFKTVVDAMLCTVSGAAFPRSPPGRPHPTAAFSRCARRTNAAAHGEPGGRGSRITDRPRPLLGQSARFRARRKNS